MNFPNEFYETLRDFQSLPRGYFVSNPNDLIPSYIEIQKPLFIKRESKRKNFDVYFTRKSLKHISEKENAFYLLNILKTILLNPESIYKSKSDNRFMYVKTIDNETFRPHAVMLEFLKNKIIIVTIFQTDEKYLKNFKILWRTGALL